MDANIREITLDILLDPLENPATREPLHNNHFTFYLINLLVFVLREPIGMMIYNFVSVKKVKVSLNYRPTRQTLHCVGERR